MKTSILFVLLSLPVISFSCDCEGRGLKYDTNYEKYIIYGEVIEILDYKHEMSKIMSKITLSNDYPEKWGFYVKLSVLVDFKGTISESEIIIVPDWSNCDYPFDLGARYFVFMDSDDNGNYTTSTCHSTFEDDEEDKKKEFYSILDN